MSFLIPPDLGTFMSGIKEVAYDGTVQDERDTRQSNMVIRPGIILNRWGENAISTGSYKKSVYINGIISSSMKTQRMHTALDNGYITPEWNIFMTNHILGFASTVK